MWSYHYFNDYWCPFSGLFNILILVLIIALAVTLCRYSCKQTREDKKQDEALALLRRRYAAGEINQEEFNQKKKDLSG